MMVLVTLVVVARFWVRFKFVKGRFGADDWCILLAWILAIAYDLDPLNREFVELCRSHLPSRHEFSTIISSSHFKVRYID